ncbi:pseudouridine synthase [Patescibacteria group bacterium]|nr:pseudouridine synthase [Patescibacteria group bacterium]MBU1673484.1 pseudouridine synthase [Patescibacteria group bacterium]MBU1963999.1 pseudouridine synthase [Patescibacteria group bacterium]
MPKIVLQKYIANSGLCSRRKAEERIRQGSVKINGQTAKLGARVDVGDVVEVDGKVIKEEKKKIYIKLNKPKGYTCTNRDFETEKNVFELIDIPERLFIAGRLDKYSRGLVILTNDGELMQELTHPKNEHEKVYHVLIDMPTQKKRDIAAEIIKKFKAGVDIGEGDGLVKAKRMKYLNNNLFEIVLTTGKKRQIRRMTVAVGFRVLDLRRIKIGKYNLGRLAEGKWEYISK